MKTLMNLLCCSLEMLFIVTVVYFRCCYWLNSDRPSDDMSNTDDSESQDTTFVIQLESDKNLHLITKMGLSDLVHNSTLSIKREFLASDLQQWNMLDKDT